MSPSEFAARRLDLGADLRNKRVAQRFVRFQRRAFYMRLGQVPK